MVNAPSAVVVAQCPINATIEKEIAAIDNINDIVLIL
jgi:hypothetical protein